MSLSRDEYPKPQGSAQSVKIQAIAAPTPVEKWFSWELLSISETRSYVSGIVAVRSREEQGQMQTAFVCIFSDKCLHLIADLGRQMRPGSLIAYVSARALAGGEDQGAGRHVVRSGNARLQRRSGRVSVATAARKLGGLPEAPNHASQTSQAAA